MFDKRLFNKHLLYWFFLVLFVVMVLLITVTHALVYFASIYVAISQLGYQTVSLWVNNPKRCKDKPINFNKDDLYDLGILNTALTFTCAFGIALANIGCL